MSKLIMWNIITLDGYFEGERNWDLSFHDAIWGPELEKLSIEQLGSADALIFGRVTYDGMSAHWKTATGEIARLMNDIPKFIFSRTLKSVDWNNATLVHGNASEEISKLKKRGNSELYLFGSADLSETFINDNQFDELRIGVAPVILGSGRPLFRSKGVLPKKLTLISTQQLSTGGAILKYKTEV
jgi:dihydrofolate reductase